VDCTFRVQLGCTNGKLASRSIGNGPEWWLFRNGWQPVAGVRLERIEQFVPPFRLGVIRIFNFQPATDGGIHSDLSLRHHAFQIVLAHGFEQINAPAFDIFSTKDIRQAALVAHLAQLVLPLD